MTMKLRYSPSSPYVRKVTVSAAELDLAEEIERLPTNPWDDSDPLTTLNPIGKVPAMETEDAGVLMGSQLICEYLNERAEGHLIPTAGPARWKTLRLQQLGDGMLDALVLAFVETARRPEDLRWQDWIDRQMDKVGRTLDYLEANPGEFDGAVTLGQIALGCALGYYEFRFDTTWRQNRPALETWYDDFAARPSMQATEPQNPV